MKNVLELLQKTFRIFSSRSVHGVDCSRSAKENENSMSFPLLQSSGQHLTLRHKMASLNARGKLNHPSSLAAVDGEVSRNEC